MSSCTSRIYEKGLGFFRATFSRKRELTLQLLVSVSALIPTTLCVSKLVLVPATSFTRLAGRKPNPRECGPPSRSFRPAR